MVDNGSTDRSSQICLEYQKKDKRFRYIYVEQKGVSNARNMGLSCAKGKIIRTDNTYTIHHFANSWQSNKVKVYGKFRRTVKKSKNPVLKIIDRLLDNAVAMVKK